MHCIAKASLAVVTMGLTLTPVAWAGWDEAVAAFKAKDYRQASELFADYLGQNPAAPQVHYMLGQSLLKEDRLLESLEPLSEALGLEPGNVSYRLGLAQGQLKAHRADAAVQTLGGQDLGALETGYQKPFDGLLAKSAVEGKDTAANLAVLRKTLEAHGRSVGLWQALAVLEDRRGNRVKVYEAYSKAYEISGDVEIGQRAASAARALAMAGTGEAKREWYEKESAIALRLVRAAATAPNMLRAGEALMSVRQFDDARSWFTQAAAMDTDDPYAPYYLASCAIAQKDGKAALAYLESSFERSPNEDLQRKILRSRGTAYRLMEEFAMAADAFREAGDTAKVAEMERLADAKQTNREWDEEKKRCEQKVASVLQLMAESEEFRGTAAWDDLEEEKARVDAECNSYFDESA